MTPGVAAYEKDVEHVPNYHDGTPRRPWSDLSEFVRWTWERNPTPRFDHGVMFDDRIAGGREAYVVKRRK